MNDNFKTALIITTIAVQKINEKKKGIPRLKQKIDNRVKNRKNREIAKDYKRLERYRLCVRIL